MKQQTEFEIETITPMFMSGGTVSYEGKLGEFLPLLIPGAWVSVGKGTSFGLGKKVKKRDCKTHGSMSYRNKFSGNTLLSITSTKIFGDP
ncbi:hypothetical protein QUF72_07750 [Desulfobacterales bacterium HSG2]|nr:hypothetical protein [Desulfobacterales bacterium HSG2]